MKEFRNTCFHGIPDEPGIRATAWKVLLGYLPPDKSLWESTLKRQRLNYYNWVRDFLEEPEEQPPSTDHPLNAVLESKWTLYFQDNSILEQIDKDVRRTLPDISFFQTYVPVNALNPLSPPVNSSYHLDEAIITSNSHYNAVQNELTDPLSGLTLTEEPVSEKESLTRRFSFGLVGRPRSSSAASKKSFKALNSTTSINNSNNILNVTSAATNNRSTSTARARSNSKSSVRSFSSGIIDSGTDIITSPKSIVRKLSTAFGSKSNTSRFAMSNTKKHQYPQQLEPICPYIPNRRSLFRRIAHLNEDVGSREHRNNGASQNMGRKALEADTYMMDYHWEAIERILFIYAKLNPGVGYVQGMNELLAPIYYVFNAKPAEDDVESQAYAEADSFFVFTALMSNVRDHFVRSLDQDASTGINATMWRMSQRLAWFDRPLFRDLDKKDIKEQYYAFRWITVLCTQEWDLPDVIRLWDSILSDRDTQEGVDETQFEFLLDFAVAMLICIRQDLIQGDFADNMRILQNYPINDIQVVLNTAYSIREARLDVIASSIIPGVNDRRTSGFYLEKSDTSSISSAGSGSRLKKLKDTTDMARASLDSLRRGSKGSLDDLFKRGLSMTRGSLINEDMDRKRASTGDMVTRSLSQRLSFANNIAAKVRRASSVRSVNNAIVSQQQQQQQSKTPITEEERRQQIHRDWLLANQSSAAEYDNINNNSIYPQYSTPSTHVRQNSITSTASSFSSSTIPANITSRTSSLMSRFSQFVSPNKPVIVGPYEQNNIGQPQNDNGHNSAFLSSSSTLSESGDKKRSSLNLNIDNAREAIMSSYRGFV
ncbi:rab-GTPase-TBC domain-containing protein [Mycotypha africana]|uniref:rab-GTPase-TBC domain-containing protein n=1 Tax=Mycotypha africana TaxID=64632 RepID=UPI00230006C4|nr:rab-GTPase-TBC domain-containing protein [Mycotypha africana]KAI8971655.1 rab-GTPase-TBC domain-containing protein [Mycotypha africana]